MSMKDVGSLPPISPYSGKSTPSDKEMKDTGSSSPLSVLSDTPPLPTGWTSINPQGPLQWNAPSTSAPAHSIREVSAPLSSIEQDLMEMNLDPFVEDLHDGTPSLDLGLPGPSANIIASPGLAPQTPQHQRSYRHKNSVGEHISPDHPSDWIGWREFRRLNLDIPTPDRAGEIHRQNVDRGVRRRMREIRKGLDED